jgi:hypothetical protein
MRETIPITNIQMEDFMKKTSFIIFWPFLHYSLIMGMARK